MNAEDMDLFDGYVRTRFKDDEYFLVSEIGINENILTSVAVNVTEQPKVVQQGWFFKCGILSWNLTDHDHMMIKDDILAQLKFAAKHQPDSYTDDSKFDLVFGTKYANTWKIFRANET